MANTHMSLSLFHIFVVVPFLLYVAFLRGKLEPWIFALLQSLGLFVLIYQSYRAIVRWRANNAKVWINILHIVAVAPLLIYIGSMGYDTPRWAYEVLAMMGFAALGYHIYSIVMMVQEMYEDEKKYSMEKREKETKI